MINFALKVAAAFSALSVVTCNAAAIEARNASRPFYAVAHRCLRTSDIDKAVDDGANAIETDMTAWTKWYADHDASGDSEGDTAEEIFNQIVKRKDDNKGIQFVWLDMKNPDWCGEDSESKECRIEHLQDMVQKILTPKGIRVMWNFKHVSEQEDKVPMKHEKAVKDSRTYKVVHKNLTDKEGVCIKGGWDKVKGDWADDAIKMPSIKRQAYDTGDINLGKNLDDVYPDIESAVKARGHTVGKVFAWTTNLDSKEETKKLLDAGIDGVIYGNTEHDYSYMHSSQTVGRALSYITDYMKDGKKKQKIHLARKNEQPW